MEDENSLNLRIERINRYIIFGRKVEGRLEGSPYKKAINLALVGLEGIAESYKSQILLAKENNFPISNRYRHESEEARHVEYVRRELPDKGDKFIEAVVNDPELIFYNLIENIRNSFTPEIPEINPS